MTITTNVGIGDLLHTRAILDAVPGEFTVTPSDQAICDARSPAYRPFVRSLCELLFTGPKYRLEWKGQGRGQTPQELARRFGLTRTPCPDFRDLLPIIGDSDQALLGVGAVLISTKIRGWHADEWLTHKPRILEALIELDRRHPTILVGERSIGMNAEYEGHGGRMIYPIYRDLAMALPDADDWTAGEYGITPPTFRNFRIDCLLMARAKAVIALGSGGNVSMGLSCGNLIGMTAGTEMDAFFSAMDVPERHRLCRSVDEFIAAVEAI